MIIYGRSHRPSHASCFSATFKVPLVTSNLLDKPAVYPFLDKLTVKVLWCLRMEGIQVQGKDGGLFTIRGVLEFKKGVYVQWSLCVWWV